MQSYAIARSQYFCGVGGVGASIAMFVFVSFVWTVRSAIPLAYLSRAGVRSIRYPNAHAHAMNSSDRCDL